MRPFIDSTLEAYKSCPRVLIARLNRQRSCVFHAFQCLKLAGEIELACSNRLPLLALRVFQVNMTDPRMIELIPRVGKWPLAHLIRVAGIPVVHQSPVRNRLEKSGNFRACANIAVVFVFDEQSDIVLPGDVNCFLQLFYNAVEYCRRICHTPESKDARTRSAPSACAASAARFRSSI